MPDVPNLPGVPALSSYSASDVILLVEDAIGALFGFSIGPQWGIFQDGVPVLSYDNQINFSYHQEWKISTYPVEDGSFQNYDKVQTPAGIICRFSAGASVTNRQAMLQSIDTVMNTTDLYDVVTPEGVFTGYNFMRREYDRTSEKAGLVVIDVFLTEVIESTSSQFTTTQSPSESAQYGGGNVSPQTPNQTVQQDFDAGGWN